MARMESQLADAAGEEDDVADFWSDGKVEKPSTALEVRCPPPARPFAPQPPQGVCRTALTRRRAVADPQGSGAPAETGRGRRKRMTSCGGRAIQMGVHESSVCLPCQGVRVHCYTNELGSHAAWPSRPCPLRAGGLHAVLLPPHLVR